MSVKDFQLEVPYTLAEKNKLATVQSSAAPNPTQVNGSEITAGTETNTRSFSPKDVADMVAAHESAGGGSGNAIEDNYTNSTGSTIAILTPVRSSAGAIDLIDPSNEVHIKKILGVTRTAILHANAGPVVLQGLIENISTGFAVDDPIYMSKTGTLTNVVPDIGVASFVAGDFVVKLGQITRNSDNPSNKDLNVDIEIIGQL